MRRLPTGTVTFLFTLLLNIVGDGLSVALNPHARQTGGRVTF